MIQSYNKDYNYRYNRPNLFGKPRKNWSKKNEKNVETSQMKCDSYCKIHTIVFVFFWLPRQILPIIVFLCLSTFFPLSPNSPRPTLLCCTYIPSCFTYSTVTGVIGPGSINSRDSIARGTQITIIQKDEPDTELVVADPSLCGVCNGGSDCRCVCLDRAP